MDLEETIGGTTTMRNTNFIPQGGQNPAQLLMQFQQFKKDFYEQNGQNADPKAAFMQYAQSNGIDQNTINQASALARQFGFK